MALIFNYDSSPVILSNHFLSFFLMIVRSLEKYRW